MYLWTNFEDRSAFIPEIWPSGFRITNQSEKVQKGEVISLLLGGPSNPIEAKSQMNVEIQLN
jgi:hypothetical protein